MQQVKKPTKVTLYKDYTKVTNDMLTKQYSAPGMWKVESKYKPAPGTFCIRPKTTSSGELSAEFEYKSEYNSGLVIRFSPQWQDDIHVTGNYELNGHKIEGVVKKHGSDELQYELSHETTHLFHEYFSLHEKLTRDSVEVGIGAEVAPHIQLGCGANYKIKSKMCDWSVTGRYVYQNYELAIRTNRLEKFITSVCTPYALTCPSPYIPDLRGKIGFITECGAHASSSSSSSSVRNWKGTLGGQLDCPLICGNTLFAKIDTSKNWAVSYLAKMSDNWTMAVSVDRNKKCGVILTHS